MKNAIKLFGIIVIAAVIGFSMAGCQNDSTSETVTYEGIDTSGVKYTLKIIENTSKAAYTPQSGDSYALTVGTKISTGTVKSFTAETLTFQLSKGTETLIVIVSSSNEIIAMIGTIVFDNGTTQNAPAFPKDALNGTIWKATDPIMNTVEYILTFSSPYASITSTDPDRAIPSISTTYSISGSTVIINSGGGPTGTEPQTGTLSGNTLTIDGLAFAKYIPNGTTPNVLDGTIWKAVTTDNKGETVNFVFTFISPIFIRFSTVKGNVTGSDSGTYSISGNTLTATANGQTMSGTLSGNTLQFDDMTFTKQ